MKDIIEALEQIQKMCRNNFDCAGCPFEIRSNVCFFSCLLPGNWDITGLKNIEE